MPFLHNVTSFVSVKCRTILMIQCEECSDRWVPRIFYQEKVTFQSHGGLNKGGSATTHYTFSLLVHFVIWKVHFIFRMNDVVSFFFFEIRQKVQKGCLCQVKKWIAFLVPMSDFGIVQLFAQFFSLNGQNPKVAKTCMLILDLFLC